MLSLVKESFYEAIRLRIKYKFPLLRNQHYFGYMGFKYFLESSNNLFQPNDFALEVKSQHQLGCTQTPSVWRADADRKEEPAVVGAADILF